MWFELLGKDNSDLYTYVGNDPMDKTDPLGLYVCDGGKKDRTTIDSFVAAINAAKGNLDPKSDAFKKVDAVSKFLGAAGEKNGKRPVWAHGYRALTSRVSVQV